MGSVSLGASEAKGMNMDELSLLADADARGRRYTESIGSRRVFPDGPSIAALARLEGDIPVGGTAPADTIELLDTIGSAGTVASNDPRYYGFVLGATLPVAAAADRLALAWDQAASSFDTSPVAYVVERQAGRWALDVLGLPTSSAVGFTTSATAGTMVALATARRALLLRDGWDIDARGLAGAPRIRVVASALIHITVRKALRILGFGLDNVEFVPVDAQGRVDVSALPELDTKTILLLQAGEVNTGEFDPFRLIMPVAQRAGAWVHVDGAFGLWARASSSLQHLAEGVDAAHSWTTDAHKWLNTPYDSAMVIVRDPQALAEAMNSDASYSRASADAQKNLTLEFSRRARGIPVWAVLHTLGRAGVARLVEQSVSQAKRAAEGLRAAGYTVHNRVVLNQVLVSAATPEATLRVIEAAQRSGATWFGGTIWNGQPAFRISVSSWRTEDEHIDQLVELLASLA